jgi:uncharacterized SAM-binding protein YcdF (DUF218 family)
MSTESEKFSSPKKFRRELIQEEFRSLLQNAKYEAPENTEAIMILSASPRGWHTEENRDKNFEEDEARIKFGFDVYKQLACRKLGKLVDEITEVDLKNEVLPFFVLNGATEQKDMMERIAGSIGVPKEKIIFLDCGRHAEANTQTQFTKTTEHPVLGKLRHFTIVSTSYHVPRIARTASKNLPGNIDFDVLGVPLKDFNFDVYRKVKGEVERIVKYAAKGDINSDVRNKTE